MIFPRAPVRWHHRGIGAWLKPRLHIMIRTSANINGLGALCTREIRRYEAPETRKTEQLRGGTSPMRIRCHMMCGRAMSRQLAHITMPQGLPKEEWMESLFRNSRVPYYGRRSTPPMAANGDDPESYGERRLPNSCVTFRK